MSFDLAPELVVPENLLQVALEPFWPFLGLHHLPLLPLKVAGLVHSLTISSSGTPEGFKAIIVNLALVILTSARLVFNLVLEGGRR